MQAQVDFLSVERCDERQVFFRVQAVVRTGSGKALPTNGAIDAYVIRVPSGLRVRVIDLH